MGNELTLRTETKQIAVNFGSLKTVDMKSHLIVFGYIRELGKKFHYKNIPTLISIKCLQFYYQHEYWDKTNIKCIDISDDRMIMKKTIRKNQTDNWDNTTYLHQWYNSNCNDN